MTAIRASALLLLAVTLACGSPSPQDLPKSDEEARDLAQWFEDHRRTYQTLFPELGDAGLIADGILASALGGEPAAE